MVETVKNAVSFLPKCTQVNRAQIQSMNGARQSLKIDPLSLIYSLSLPLFMATHFFVDNHAASYFAANIVQAAR